MAVIDQYFKYLVESGGSDLHLSEGQPPKIRVNGTISAISDENLEGQAFKTLLSEICDPQAFQKYLEEGDLDFAYEMDETSRFRCNYFKQQHGLGAVFRLIPTKIATLEELGVPTVVKEFAHMRSGLVLVTGPTGSGKTTTLYACLNHINRPDKKIITVEDPVEYELSGINQVMVKADIGMTFAAALRAMLRQAPNIIMIGEIRDMETASIAINASLTGHLVLSTLHTNDSAGAITRLVDMGCEPFLVAASLEGVLAQRLVRTICPDCRTPYEPSSSILSQLGVSPYELGDKHFYTGRGCDKCSNSGYKGRKGIYELLDINDTLRDMITDRAPSVVLKQKAIEMGMSTLREDGLRNIYDGNTTIEDPPTWDRPTSSEWP